MPTVRVTGSERVVLGGTVFTLSFALASWVLMRFGAYTFQRVALISSCWFVAFALVTRGGGGGAIPERQPRHWLALAAVTCLAFGLLYATYPTYFLMGGQDPGPYLAFGARIAKTGGLDLRVPEIQRWAREHNPGFYRAFPGMYGNMGSVEPSALHPQFVHLFTAYMANFWATFGVEGAVRSNAWVGALCLATGFAWLRRFGSLVAAFALLVALGVNPAFVWASRITLTEMVALWLNLSGLLLLLVAWDRESFAWGALGAFVLGLGVLNRLDGGLSAFAVLGFAAATLPETGRRPRIAVLVAVVHGALIALGYADGQRLAPEYFRDLNNVSGGTVSKLIALTLGLDVIALVLSALPARLLTKLFVTETTLRLGAYALALGLFMWVLYGFTLRPVFDKDPETSGALLELTWYLSHAAWPLFFVGLIAALGPRGFQRSLPLVIFTAGALYIYTSRTDVAHAHIWASRRWVPHVIPFILLVAALGFAHVTAGVRKVAARYGATRPRALAGGAALVLGAACLLPMLDFDRPFLFRSMLDGLPAAYERVAKYGREHRNQWPILTDNTQFGSILTYAYGVPTVLLNERGGDAALKGAFVGEIGVGFNAFDLRNGEAFAGRYHGKYLKPTSTERPSELVDLRLPLEGGVFGPSQFDFEMPAASSCFQTRQTTPQGDGSLVANGGRGPIFWGPWASLEPGRYHVEWHGSVDPGRHKHRGYLDVIREQGKESFAEMKLEADENPGERLLGALDFGIDKPTTGIEFRVRVEPNSGVRLSRLRFQRL